MSPSWTESTQLRPYGGHGIDFFADAERAAGTLIAVIRGFDWLVGPREIEVAIRPADSSYDAAFLAEARVDIERMLQDAAPLPDQCWISPRLFVHVNA